MIKENICKTQKRLINYIQVLINLILMNQFRMIKI